MGTTTEPDLRSDERRRQAAKMLGDLMTLPDRRPGCWEEQHVQALEADYLAPIFDVLTGAADVEGDDLHSRLDTLETSVSDLKAEAQALCEGS